jgi:hypothetical protein
VVISALTYYAGAVVSRGGRFRDGDDGCAREPSELDGGAVGATVWGGRDAGAADVEQQVTLFSRKESSYLQITTNNDVT